MRFLTNPSRDTLISNEQKTNKESQNDYISIQNYVPRQESKPKVEKDTYSRNLYRHELPRQETKTKLKEITDMRIFTSKERLSTKSQCMSPIQNRKMNYESPLIIHKRVSVSPKIKYVNDNMFHQIKIKQFIKIFKLLDQDEDGYISSFNAALTNIPYQILKILGRLVIKLKTDNINMSIEEFVEECNNIFAKCTFLEKKILLNFHQLYDRDSLLSNNFVLKVLNSKEYAQATTKEKNKLMI